jgi:hypothetical protein
MRASSTNEITSSILVASAAQREPQQASAKAWLSPSCRVTAAQKLCAARRGDRQLSSTLHSSSTPALTAPLGALTHRLPMACAAHEKPAACEGTCGE